MKLNGGDIRPTEDNVKDYRDMKPPRTIKDAWNLLSSFSYYQRFLKDFTRTAKPIADLLKGTQKLKNTTRIKWTAECEEAFQKLKDRITSCPILQLFDDKKETYLQCDASSYAIGSVLLPKKGEKELKPVAFYSEKLPERKRHLCSFDLELIVIEKSLKHFRNYCYMRPVQSHIEQPS